MAIPVGAATYDRNFSFVSEVAPGSEHRVDASRQIHLGERAKYLRVLDDNEKVHFDLSIGNEMFTDKDPEHERLDVLLRWAVEKSVASGCCRPKEVFSGADIVTTRGLLMRMAITPFYVRDAWRAVAVRVQDIVYMCEYFCDEKEMQRHVPLKARELLMTFWGFKFEQYMTSDESPHGTPDTTSPINCREQFEVLNITRIGVPGDRGRQIRLAFPAEVDAIDEDGKLVELKTCQNGGMDGYKFWRNKSCKWWTQSYLSGIDRIIVGLRDAAGIVREVRSVHLSELTRSDNYWNGNVCINFLATVLSTIEERLPPGSADYGSCQVEYDPRARIVRVGEARRDEADFITDDYIRQFKLPQKPSC